jgi:hypothetical protein
MFATFQQRISNATVEMLYNLLDSFTWRCILRLGLVANCFISVAEESYRKNLIIDTDFFSDVE